MAICFCFSFALFNIGVAILCISFFIRRLAARDFSSFDRFQDIALLIYFFFAVFSVLQTPHLALALQGVQKLFRYLLLFIAAREILTDAGKIPSAVRLFLAGGIIAGADAISQWIFGQDILAGKTPHPGLSTLIRLTGPFGNPNTLAIYLSYFIPLLYLVFRRQSSIKKAGLGIALVLTLSALVMTYSRPAALSLGVCALIIVIVKKDWFILSGGLLLLIAGFFSAPADVRQWMGNLHNLTGFLYDVSRAFHHQAAWNMIRDNFLFGVGLNTFDLNYSNYKEVGDAINRWSAHHAYLQIWAETGILGLISFIAVLVGIARFALRGILKAENTVIKDILIGLSLGALSFLIIAFFESSFWQPRQTYFFWLWAGFLCGAAKLARRSHV